MTGGRPDEKLPPLDFKVRDHFLSPIPRTKLINTGWISPPCPWRGLVSMARGYQRYHLQLCRSYSKNIVFTPKANKSRANTMTKDPCADTMKESMVQPSARSIRLTGKGTKPWSRVRTPPLSFWGDPFIWPLVKQDGTQTLSTDFSPPGPVLFRLLDWLSRTYLGVPIQTNWTTRVPSDSLVCSTSIVQTCRQKSAKVYVACLSAVLSSTRADLMKSLSSISSARRCLMSSTTSQNGWTSRTNGGSSWSACMVWRHCDRSAKALSTPFSLVAEKSSIRACPTSTAQTTANHTSVFWSHKCLTRSRSNRRKSTTSNWPWEWNLVTIERYGSQENRELYSYEDGTFY